MPARSDRAVALLLIAAAGCLGGGGITPIRTHFNKGVYHYSTGDLDAALAEYRLALEEDALDWRARFNLAVALEAKAALDAKAGHAEQAATRRSEAEQAYRTILAQRPGDLRAAVNLAAAEYERGERDAAKHELQALIAAAPDASLPRTALAAHWLREASETTDAAAAGVELARARTMLEDAVQRDPADASANMLLGDVRARLGEPDGARAAYRRALEREPSDLATLLALGRLEIGAGDVGAAAAPLQRALYVDPDCTDAHRLLADVLERQDDLEDAVRNLWEARRLDGDAARYRARLLDLYRRLIEREQPPKRP